MVCLFCGVEVVWLIRCFVVVLCVYEDFVVKKIGGVFGGVFW